MHLFAKDNLHEEVQFIGQLGDNMSKTNTNRKVDKRVFKRTAATTKKVNISPKVMRGGTRL